MVLLGLLFGWLTRVGDPSAAPAAAAGGASQAPHPPPPALPAAHACAAQEAAGWLDAPCAAAVAAARDKGELAGVEGGGGEEACSRGGGGSAALQLLAGTLDSARRERIGALLELASGRPGARKKVRSSAKDAGSAAHAACVAPLRAWGACCRVGAARSAA